MASQIPEAERRQLQEVYRRLCSQALPVLDGKSRDQFERLLVEYGIIGLRVILGVERMVTNRFIAEHGFVVLNGIDANTGKPAKLLYLKSRLNTDQLQDKAARSRKRVDQVAATVNKERKELAARRHEQLMLVFVGEAAVG